MNWTSYASLITASTILLFAAPSAYAYFYSQESEVRPVAECGSGCTYELVVGDQTYVLKYGIAAYHQKSDPDTKTVQVNSITLNPDSKTLVVDLNATSYGKFYINLPRSLIQASDGTSDAAYTVLVNGQEANDDVIELTNVSEAVGPDERRLSIAFDSGTKKIEIIGTHVAPEFITPAALAAAVTGIIIMHRFRMRKLSQ